MHVESFRNIASWKAAVLCSLILAALPIFHVAQAAEPKPSELTTIHQDFSEDPGWEAFHNRVVCSDCPTVTQNFGWSPAADSGDAKSTIGGTICRSTRPAYYAMPIGPFSFADKLKATGKLSVTAPAQEGWGFYIGFFNHYRQGWRVWSSCGFRIGEVKNGAAKFHLDYKTGRNKGAILNPDFEIPCDGSVHTWEYTYEPNATVGESWPDKRLPQWIGPKSNVHEDMIFARAKQQEPALTRERLHRLLVQARDAGLVDHWYKKGAYHLWDIEKNAEGMKGRITLRFDDHPPVSYFLLPGHCDEPSHIDRFGIWNQQIYHGSMQFHVSDLNVNGKKIDLSQDPHWDGLNNRVTFEQTDFHSRQDFGYTQTNWAGTEAGEIGGRFWGTEVIDPLHAFYADEIGSLTLEDPISFSGWINFTEGAVDGRMLIGYFNRAARLADVPGEYKGNPPHQFLGIEVMDQTQIGYSFTAVCSPRQEIAFEKRGPIYIPDRIKRPFSFTYDPDAGDAGRITMTLGPDKLTADLTSQQREAGATFDRFGLLNPRKGGKYVDVYVDELIYVARRPDNHVPIRHKQQRTVVPYPRDGRKYK